MSFIYNHIRQIMEPINAPESVQLTKKLCAATLKRRERKGRRIAKTGSRTIRQTVGRWLIGSTSACRFRSVSNPAWSSFSQEGGDPFLRVARDCIRTHHFLRVSVSLRLIKIDLCIEGSLAQRHHHIAGFGNPARQLDRLCAQL